MSRNLIIGLFVVLLLVLGYFYFTNQPAQPNDTTLEDVTVLEEDSEPLEEDNTMTVELEEQNDSGESGVATLVEENGQITVSISMSGSPEAVPQPAHIHAGECPDVGAVEYPLTNLEDGVSVTTLETTMEQLNSQMPLAINVHKSVPEADVYTSCGNLEF